MHYFFVIFMLFFMCNISEAEPTILSFISVGRQALGELLCAFFFLLKGTKMYEKI
jgi:hypothetical protein